MAKNYINSGTRGHVDSASGAIVSGALVVQEGLIGVALETAKSGAALDLGLTGIWDITVPSGTAKGDRLYTPGAPPTEDNAPVLTKVSTSNTLIGVALTARDATTLTAKVLLAGYVYAQTTAEVAGDVAVPGVVEGGKEVTVDLNKHIDTIGIAVGGLKLGTTGAEVAVSGTAAELNVVAGVTAGTGLASKAVVLDANGMWGYGTDSVPISTATADKKFISLYTRSTAASGDVRGIYAKTFFGGATGGEAARFYAAATAAGVAAGGTMNGIHVTADIHSGASISGQANAIRATIGTEDAASTPGGTLAAITAETNFYAGSTLPATAFYQRFVTLAGTVQPANVFSFEGLGATAFASAGTGANSAALAGGGVAAKVLKVKVDGTDYWMPLFSSNS